LNLTNKNVSVKKTKVRMVSIDILINSISMNDLHLRIDNLFQKNNVILLKRGGPYWYKKMASTKINGIAYEYAFEYEISKKNRKRITLLFIEYLFDHYKIEGRILNRNEMIIPFEMELHSSPCNYSVAKYIVEQLIRE
jgi:hypothetical protein